MSPEHEPPPPAGRELLILRHAKSSWDAVPGGDFARPLARRGLKQAPRMGKWLRKEGLAPDAILSSPAERARQTALAVTQALHVARGAVHFDERIYLAPLATLLGVLGDAPRAARRVLLVGHNPGLDELLVHLCGPDVPRTDAGKLLTTAALARLAMPDAWQDLPAGTATLLRLIRPRDLE